MIQTEGVATSNDKKEVDYLELHILVIRLAVLSTYESALKPLSKWGCVGVLMTFLREGQMVEIQQAAAFTIANIAKPFSNRAAMVANGAIPQLQELVECNWIDPDARVPVQKALDYLYSYFCHTYLTLFRHTPVLSSQNKRKHDTCSEDEYQHDMVRESKKSNVRVEYSEELEVVCIDIDEDTKQVKFT